MFLIKGKMAWCFSVLVVIYFFWVNVPIKNSTSELWDTSELLYVSPDTNQTELDFVIHDGIFDIIKRHFRTLFDGGITGDSLDFTKVYHLQIDESGNQIVQRLADETYPSEFISIKRDHIGALHFMWGERRVDPFFKEWEIPRPRIAGFATSKIYNRYKDDLEYEESISVYDGELSSLGIGSLSFPANMAVNSSNQLHTVFHTDSTFQTTDLNGEPVTGYMPVSGYLNRDVSGNWSDMKLFDIGHSPDISILPDDRIVIAAFGSSHEHVSTNDIFIQYSDDNGKTWSDRKLIFVSESEPGLMLRLDSSLDGTLHVIWGRQTSGELLPDEMWHTYSEDGGNTWYDAKSFLKLKPDSDFSSNKILSFDIVVDNYGTVHWTAESIQRGTRPSEKTLHYAKWNPLNKAWGNNRTIESAIFPGSAKLAIDQATQKLYLVWSDTYNNENFKAYFYKSRAIQEPARINEPPTNFEAGPIQLHPNYPNPFNSSTVISFILEQPGEVILEIYDLNGRRHMEKYLGYRYPGWHNFRVDLSNAASGNYIYNLNLNGIYSQQGQMQLIK